MVKPFLLIFALAVSAQAETFRIFGSAGAESQRTPENAESPLAPFATLPEHTNVGDVTLFADAAPESRRWKLHLKLRADASDRGTDKVEAGAAFVQVRPAPWLDITAGRVIEKWGTGYAWNPTAFVSPAKDPSDPNDRRSAYRGLDMIKANLFFRDTSISLYGLRGGAYAARAYRMVHGTDVAVHFRHDEASTQAGLSVARVFGDALELHAEVARRRALVGGQYTFRNHINVVLELYHSDDGLSTREWADFRGSISAAEQPSRSYVPLQMGRDYAFVRIVRAYEQARLQAEVITIVNLRDGSGLARLSVTHQLRPNLSLYLIDTEFAGSGESEFGYMPLQRATTLGVRLYF